MDRGVIGIVVLAIVAYLLLSKQHSMGGAVGVAIVGLVAHAWLNRANIRAYRLDELVDPDIHSGNLQEYVNRLNIRQYDANGKIRQKFLLNAYHHMKDVEQFHRAAWAGRNDTNGYGQYFAPPDAMKSSGLGRAIGKRLDLMSLSNIVRELENAKGIMVDPFGNFVAHVDMFKNWGWGRAGYGFNTDFRPPNLPPLESDSSNQPQYSYIDFKLETAGMTGPIELTGKKSQEKDYVQWPSYIRSYMGGRWEEVADYVTTVELDATCGSKLLVYRFPEYQVTMPIPMLPTPKRTPKAKMLPTPEELHDEILARVTSKYNRRKYTVREEDLRQLFNFYYSNLTNPLVAEYLSLFKPTGVTPSKLTGMMMIYKLN